MQSCYAMDKHEIRELQGLYVAAASGRARLDSTSSTSTSGTVTRSPTSSSMPFFNKRTDEYGGSFENRARFWLETLELVRRPSATTAQSRFALRVDSLATAPSSSIDEAIAVHRTRRPPRRSLGCPGRRRRSPNGARTPARVALRPARTPSAPGSRRSGRRRTKPIVGVGRFTSPDTMVEVVSSGPLGHHRRGTARRSPIRSSRRRSRRADSTISASASAATSALARYNQHSLLICTQNATAGEEYRRGWHPEQFAPAENADTTSSSSAQARPAWSARSCSASAGMRRVHLVDAGAEIGGCVRWISQLPGLGEWARIINYRKIQLDKLKNVEVITARRSTPRTSSTTAPRSSSSRPARTGRRTA